MRRLLLVLAVVFSTLALAQEKDASPPAAVTAEPAPAPAAKSAAPATVTEPRAKAETAEPVPYEWWREPQWWLVAALCVVALVGAGLALYAYRLWKATSELLRTTAATGKKELRAYAALDEIFFEEAADNAPGVHKLRIRNYGQTPAYHMSIWCERASHLPKDGVNPYYDTPIVDAQLLHPVQAYTVSLAAAPLYRIGKPGFFTYGRLVYHDIYGEWWVTKFCYRYEGDGGFVPHGDYNNEEGPFEKRPA